MPHHDLNDLAVDALHFETTCKLLNWPTSWTSRIPDSWLSMEGRKWELRRCHALFCSEDTLQHSVGDDDPSKMYFDSCLWWQNNSKSSTVPSNLGTGTITTRSTEGGSPQAIPPPVSPTNETRPSATLKSSNRCFCQSGPRPRHDFHHQIRTHRQATKNKNSVLRVEFGRPSGKQRIPDALRRPFVKGGEHSVSALSKQLLSVPVPVLSPSPSVLSCRSPSPCGTHAQVVDDHFL